MGNFWAELADFVIGLVLDPWIDRMAEKIHFKSKKQ